MSKAQLAKRLERFGAPTVWEEVNVKTVAARTPSLPGGVPVSHARPRVSVIGGTRSVGVTRH